MTIVLTTPHGRGYPCFVSQGEGGGRPRKFETVKDIETLSQAYFTECKTTGDPLTITGLAMAMGHTSRNVLIDYESGIYDTETEKFSHAIKACKLCVENYAEKGLYLAKAAAGPIFHLSNMGWENRQKTEHSGTNGGPIIIASTPADEKL